MIDSLKCAPDADPASVNEGNFLWIVDAVVRLLVRKCQEICSYLVFLGEGSLTVAAPELSK
jgi:hypothetical protein